jgi:hypothetical protein
VAKKDNTILEGFFALRRTGRKATALLIDPGKIFSLRPVLDKAVEAEVDEGHPAPRDPGRGWGRCRASTSRRSGSEGPRWPRHSTDGPRGAPTPRAWRTHRPAASDFGRSWSLYSGSPPPTRAGATVQRLLVGAR